MSLNPGLRQTSMVYRRRQRAQSNTGDATVVKTQYVQNAPSLAMSYTPMTFATEHGGGTGT